MWLPRSENLLSNRIWEIAGTFCGIRSLFHISAKKKGSWGMGSHPPPERLTQLELRVRLQLPIHPLFLPSFTSKKGSLSLSHTFNQPPAAPCPLPLYAAPPPPPSPPAPAPRSASSAPLWANGCDGAAPLPLGYRGLPREPRPPHVGIGGAAPGPPGLYKQPKSARCGRGRGVKKAGGPGTSPVAGCVLRSTPVYLVADEIHGVGAASLRHGPCLRVSQGP